MSWTDQEYLNAALRLDQDAFLHRVFQTLHPGAFYQESWHLQAINFKLKQIRNGEVKRLIINAPPRSLKSIAVSVAGMAFLLGHNPKLKIFVISYSNELADKLARDFLTVVTSEWYKKAFPRFRISRTVDGDVYTTERGFRRITSVNATLTGFGGDLFVIDDPLKASDAYFDSLRNRVNDWVPSTLISRLDNKATGQIIVVMQRVHQQDLTGYLLDNSTNWDHLCLPAIADAKFAIGPGKFHFRREGDVLQVREPLSVLADIKQDIGSEHFAAQYQQAPVPAGGAMLYRKWFRYYDAPPPRTYETKVLLSWDVAAKAGGQNDCSVCTVWMVVTKQEYYLLDMVRGRYEFPKLREMAILQAEKWKPHCVLVEDASTGIALAQELKHLGSYAIKPVPVERDKISRLFVQQHKFEAGLVRFPKGAPFMADVEAELLSFLQGRTDDIVDSMTQALAYKLTGYDTTLSWV